MAWWRPKEMRHAIGCVVRSPCISFARHRKTHVMQHYIAHHSLRLQRLTRILLEVQGAGWHLNIRIHQAVCSIGERETSRVQTELILCRHCYGRQSRRISTVTPTIHCCAAKRTEHVRRLRTRQVSGTMWKWEMCSWIIRAIWYEIPLFVTSASVSAHVCDRHGCFVRIFILICWILDQRYMYWHVWQCLLARLCIDIVMWHDWYMHWRVCMYWCVGLLCSQWFVCTPTEMPALSCLTMLMC